MVECKVIKRDEIPKNNMPDIIEKTLENIKGVGNIASSVFVCPESEVNIINNIGGGNPLFLKGGRSRNLLL